MGYLDKKLLSTELSTVLMDAFQEEATSAPWELFTIGYGSRTAWPLSTEARIEGLAKIWSEAKYNFAYWDQLPGEDWWDQQFRSFVPRVLAVETEESYWRLLQLFAGLLGDGHTWVQLPRHLRQATSRPPVLVLDIEGKPIVIAGEGVPPGAEIVSINGRPADQVRQEMAETMPASTRHNRAARTALNILDGPAGTPVVVEVCLPGGGATGRCLETVSLERTGPLPLNPTVQRKEVQPGVFLVAIHNFNSHTVADSFDQLFPDFEGVEGLIFDLRLNTGGDNEVGYRILARLIDAKIKATATRLPLYAPTIRAWGMTQRWLALPPEEVRPADDRPRYSGPVAVLSSPITGSAAEDFLVAFKTSGRGPVVGQPTAGSTGQPMVFALPGGGVLLICTKRDTFADGVDYVGRGVMPDIPCQPSVADISSQRDRELDTALVELAAER